jgi:Helicase associated domain
VAVQRRAGISDIETNPMRRQALDDIGFVWQVKEPGYTRDERWNDMFQLLQEYQAEHGDCLVPTYYVTKDEEPLGMWVQTQRKELASGKLFKDLYKDRLQKLQSIGFELRAMPDDSNESRWTRLFGQLVEYQRQHGDCLVPAEYAGNLALGDWVTSLRVKGDTLSRDHREQLDAIGFVWDFQETAWNAKFHELQRFQQQHGHCLVSRKQHNTEYLGLVSWVYRQRFKRHTMDTKRIQQLDSIGFVWDYIETAWNTKFHELQRFQRQHGHSLVTRKQHDAEYPGLDVWVYKQRFNRHTMDAERIQQLDSIGFVWDARDANWDAMFEKLCQYRAIHGDCKVNRSYHDKKLANWVTTQRSTTFCTKLSPEQRAQLHSIGFFG